MKNQPTEYQPTGSEIAIIGMSCRFPGADNLEQFWRNLRDGLESITSLSDDELEDSSIDTAALNDPNYVKAASLIRDVDAFDAPFFGVSPKEAEVMDPQHRLFLECSWQALEHAGYDAGACRESIGVFAGARTNTYLFNLYTNREEVGSSGAFEVGLGNDLAFLSSRVSHKLNLRGPSYSVHTACSTGLVAVHMACQSLLIDECQIALAGAVAVNVPQKTGYLYQRGGIMSPDGHCRAFDARAQGTVFGSGVGVLVLKRLEDALADGDTIHAVIKGSAVNNDGSSKASFTAPSVRGQAEVISEALANSGVEADSINYVEAHGTGTSLGDPIEIRALTRAFRETTEAKKFCAIGSVKTNFGHLDAAAGMASIIKTVLSLKHKQIPPSLHFEQPNPHIDFDESPFYVNTSLAEWEAGPTPRRAGVSSFGVGGTNAHVVLEEAPEPEPADGSRPWQLLTLSAKTEAALETATENLIAHLGQAQELNLADVAYTLQVGRQPFNHRRVVVCQGAEGAVAALEGADPRRVNTGFMETGEQQVLFMFPGQGSQYINMGLELYRSEPVFAQHVNYCSELLAPELGLDLRDLIFAGEAGAEDAAGRLDQTALAQPALFVIEYSLARLFMSWGVQPQAMIGHSLGEYVAACLAEVFSLEDALKLVAARGRLMQRLPGGAMLAVPLAPDKLRPLLGEELSLAAVNGPSLCVVSGPVGAVDELERKLEAEEGARCQRLRTSHAFHSGMMDAAIDPFTEEVRKVELSRPRIPFVSNVTGAWITAAEATDPAYWARHLRQTVLFDDGVRALLNETEGVLLEVGPGTTLTGLVKRHMNGSARQQSPLASMRRRDDQESDMAALLMTLGGLWQAGVQIDWAGFYGREQRRRVVLPTYPFERHRYWIGPAAEAAKPSEQRAAGLGKKSNIAEWFYQPSWKRVPALRPFDAQALPDAQRYCLVLEDDAGLGAKLAARLRAEGLEVISVRSAEGFGRGPGGDYTINPRSQADYESLLKEVRASGKTPGLILHLWGTGGEAASGRDYFGAAQEAGFYSLLYWAPALGNQTPNDPVRLCVVSDRTQALESADAPLPEKATALAALRVIPQEHDFITCSHVDVALPAAGTTEESELIDRVAAELTSKSFDAVVAYRGGQRWVQTFEPLPLEADDRPVRALREKGVYLITGGMGAVGLLLAEYLARNVRARLVLTGRSNFPPREEWESWLVAHDDEDEVSRKIRRLRGLEELGAEVLVVSADVADEGQMRSAIMEASERFGQINGVIHAAGVTSGSSVFKLISEISPDQVELQFQPKAYGLYALENALRGERPDFCLLFSSNASVLGGLGFVAYAAANGFMDAFAAARGKASGFPWVSVNWDHWPEETKKYTGYQTSMDQYTMTREESLEAFRRAATMADGSGQLVVSTGDLNARLNLWVKRGDGKRQARVASAPARRTASRGGDSAPRNETERIIADAWRDVLGVERVGINDSFIDLGGHSLLALRIIGRLRDDLRIEIPLIKFFETPTVAGLAQTAAQIQAEQEESERREVLEMLASLSEEEVSRELEKRMNNQ